VAAINILLLLMQLCVDPTFIGRGCTTAVCLEPLTTRRLRLAEAV